MCPRFIGCFLSFAAMSCCAIEAGAADKIQYSTQIAPLLRTYCVGCHNRVEAEGRLSLQTPDDLVKGGENGTVLDDAAPLESRMLQVVLSRGDDHMPPTDEPQLSAEELELLKQWISEGADFDSRMAVLPVLPKVEVTASKVRSPALTMQVGADGGIFVGRFRTVEKISGAAGKTEWSMSIPDGKVNDLRLSTDGKRVLLATGTPGLSGRAIEVAVGESQLLREFTGHNDILYAAVWSPGEKFVATAGYDRRIILHDARTGAHIREFPGHNGAIFDLAFSPDGTLLASASADATIKIWHVATGERFDTLSQPQAEQYSVVFSPDGKFVFGAGADNRIRQWQMISRTAPQINPLLVSRFAHEGAVTRLSIFADGSRLVSAADDGSIRIWNASDVSQLSAMTLQSDLVSSLAIDDGEQLVRVATFGGEDLRIPWPSVDPASVAVDEEMPQPVMPLIEVAAMQDVAEAEPNDDIAAAQIVPFPAKITGVINVAAADRPDGDVFRFEAHKGQPLLIEVRAARDNSPLDSVVEVLDVEGRPVLQAQLQAVRDSYFTFRGKDSDTSDDFRVFNWQEMDLNEYLYADGEVVKLWLYPRGPDSGFKVYPGLGNRQTYFGTTPTSHPLQGPAFIVVPHDPDAVLRDTGLPVFPVYFSNDDDPLRQWGKDSRVVFHPPTDGAFLVRLKDARGFQGADFKYQLQLRSPHPDFSVAMGGNELSIHKGTGREISFTATRLDGYDGPIEIFAENLPVGFSLSDPVTIQGEQRQAFATLLASPDAVQPADEDVAKIVFRARATPGGAEVIHDIGGMKSLKVQDNPRILVTILTDEQYAAGQDEHTPELTVYAGETTRAWLRVSRRDHDGLVEFGKEDSGRNMPHGVFVDNIGLNGLMLLNGQTEREIFIKTAKWVPEISRPFYLKSSVDGGITSLPVMLHVRHRDAAAPTTAKAE